MITKEFLHAEDFVLQGTGTGEKNEWYARWFIHQMRLPLRIQEEFAQFMSGKILMCVYENEPYMVAGVSKLGDVILTREDWDRSIRISVNIAECSGWHKGDK